MKKMTHTANEVGIAYNRGITRKIEIRETTLYWINQYGTKYYKKNGSLVGERYSTFELDLNSIKEIEYTKLKQRSEVMAWKTFDFLCTNEKCVNYMVKVERMVKDSEKNSQVCEFCVEVLIKGFGSISIKTGDNGNRLKI